MTSRIFLTALLTDSASGAVTYACRGSSSPGSGCPSFLPTLPSFTLPFPRIIILAPVSFSMFLRVFPRGPGEHDFMPFLSLLYRFCMQQNSPIRSPTKLISGCSSCGIITLSDTFTVGALERKILRCGYNSLSTDFELVLILLQSIDSVDFEKQNS